ncbi:macro domain-containing protein [Leptolyngbya sp. CCNP1308]|uniref:macro domain-containing protein n=1 Tax=Leptolyngbya sp. CCNP1308 TaxID=3110255 RepID=UPI002B213495|nr:macro domain-containing protein [Leptolyngbya sp. CCNP1308]MEA5449140.1 macro domain-containing protein [Leptolyngbya sp. CCNP1308]
MKDLIDPIVTFLKEVEFHVLLLTLGFFLLVISLFNVGYVNAKWTISTQFSLLPFVSGCLFVFFALAVFLLESDSLAVFKTATNRQKDLPRNIICTVVYKDTNINVIYGEIQNFGDDIRDNRYAVVLPTNDSFSHECFYDTKSALGAYMNAKFRREDPVTGQVNDQIPTIQEKVENYLQEFPSQEIEGSLQKRYSIGTCLYLEKPLSIPCRLLIVAVAQSVGESFRATIPFIFIAIDEIRKVVLKHRISRLYIPLLGAGHGGLEKKEAAFFVLLLAILDVLLGSSGAASYLESVNIVIYKGKKSSNILSPVLLKRNARIAVNMFNK